MLFQGIKKRTPGSQNHQLPATVIALGWVSLLTDIGSEMIYPLLPAFVVLIGSGAFVLGLMEGLAETTSSLLKLFSGYWSDRMGRKKTLVIMGYGISSLIRPVTGMVTQGWHLVFTRLVDRIGKGIRTAPRDALIAGTAPVPVRGKAFGFHRAMDHLGAVLGPVAALISFWMLGSLFNIKEEINLLRITFLMAIFPGLLSVVVLFIFVREKREYRSPSGKLKFFQFKTDRNFLKYLGVIFLFTLGNSSDVFLLYRANEMLAQNNTLEFLASHFLWIRRMMDLPESAGLSRTTIHILLLPVIWSWFHLIKMALSTPFGSLSDRIGRKKLILAGWIIYVLVYLSFAYLNHLDTRFQLTGLFLLFAVYATYYALCEGAEKALVADMVPPEKRGTSYGLYHFAVGAGALPSSLLFGLIYQSFGGKTAFIAGSFMVFLAILFLTFTVNEKKLVKR